MGDAKLFLALSWEPAEGVPYSPRRCFQTSGITLTFRYPRKHYFLSEAFLNPSTKAPCNLSSTH